MAALDVGQRERPVCLHVAGSRSRDLRRQVRHLDARLAFGQHDGAFHGVLELAHVARPVVGEESIERGRRQRAGPAVVGRTAAPHEGVSEREHVLAPLAQRGHLDGEHLEPEVEILAEGALAHHLGQVAVRGRDDTHVDALALRAPDTADLVVLEHAQELHLYGERYLADLVEQQGATARRLDEPLLVPVPARERAPDVAEQLGL